MSTYTSHNADVSREGIAPRMALFLTCVVAFLHFVAFGEEVERGLVGEAGGGRWDGQYCYEA